MRRSKRADGQTIQMHNGERGACNKIYKISAATSSRLPSTTTAIYQRLRLTTFAHRSFLSFRSNLLTSRARWLRKMPAIPTSRMSRSNHLMMRCVRNIPSIPSAWSNITFKLVHSTSLRLTIASTSSQSGTLRPIETMAFVTVALSQTGP